MSSFRTSWDLGVCADNTFVVVSSPQNGTTKSSPTTTHGIRSQVVCVGATVRVCERERHTSRECWYTCVVLYAWESTLTLWWPVCEKERQSVDTHVFYSMCERTLSLSSDLIHMCVQERPHQSPCGVCERSSSRESWSSSDLLYTWESSYACVYFERISKLRAFLTWYRF
jgi:hypothetical protein